MSEETLKIFDKIAFLENGSKKGGIFLFLIESALLLLESGNTSKALNFINKYNELKKLYGIKEISDFIKNLTYIMKDIKEKSYLKELDEEGEEEQEKKKQKK